MSFLASKESRLFLDKRHSDLVQGQKNDIYHQLSVDVEQNDEYLEHIRNLSQQVEYLQQALLENAP